MNYQDKLVGFYNFPSLDIKAKLFPIFPHVPASKDIPPQDDRSCSCPSGGAPIEIHMAALHSESANAFQSVKLSLACRSEWALLPTKA